MKSFAALLVLIPLTAYAATITVNTTADNLTAADGRCTLREAIANVNAAADTTGGDCAAATGSSDTINFSGLTLPATVTLALGELDIGKDVAISGPGADQLTLDGNHASQIFAVGSSLTLSNVTIRNGVGSAIWNFGRLTLANCTLSDNSASRGGAIFNSGSMALTNCMLSNNSATSAFGGGGIYNHYDGDATLTACTLTGNSASAGGGGGIYSIGTLVLVNCTLTDNAATASGGAIVNSNVLIVNTHRLRRGRATLTGCTLSNNSGSNGGGIVNEGDATLTGCLLSGNVATNFGGGIYNGLTAHSGVVSKMSLANCTLIGNAATSGGGIYSNDPARTWIKSGTLSGNAATSYGGGIFNAGRFVRLRDTVLANSPSGGNCAGAAVSGRGARNLEDGSSCDLRGKGCTHHAGRSFCNTAPRLDAAGLANNGGPTQTIAVDAESPAIDSGAQCPPTDQRSFARPGINPAINRPFRRCTIGAYEFNSPGCRPEDTLCTDTCVDLQKDPGNCGACGLVCAVGQKCSKAVCQ